jgi:hypothetical protein
MKKILYLLFVLAIMALLSCNVVQKFGDTLGKPDQLFTVQQLVVQNKINVHARKQPPVIIDKPITEVIQIQTDLTDKHFSVPHSTLSRDFLSKQIGKGINPERKLTNKIPHAILNAEKKHTSNIQKQPMHDWLRIWVVALIFGVLFLLFALLPGIGPLFSILAYIALSIFVIAFAFWILQYL